MKTNFLISIIIFLQFLSPSIQYKNHNQSISFILEYLRLKQFGFGYFFNCRSKNDNHNLLKIIQSEPRLKIRTTFISLENLLVKKLQFDQVYNRIGFVLDLQSCEGIHSVSTLEQHFSQGNLFLPKNHWLIIENTNGSIEVFRNLSLRMDADLTIAIPGEEISGDYKMLSLYNPGRNSKIIVNEIGSFRKGYLYLERARLYDRRNMSGVFIKSATVLSGNYNGTLDSYMQNLKYKDVDVISRYHYQIFLLLQQFHKFSFHATVTSAWFGNLTNGTDAGVAKLLYDHTVDISCTGGLQKVARIDVIDYLIPTYKFRACFFFRNPGIHNYFSNEILKPFSINTWYAILAAAVVMCVFLRFIYYVEGKRQPRGRTVCVYSWVTSVFVIIAAFCQQSVSTIPQHLAGRSVYLTLLLLSLLLYNYYTSSLVSALLSIRPALLSTITQLIQSKLQISIENQPYTITYLKLTNTEEVLRLNATKIHVYNVDDGIKKVRDEKVAYHTETSTAYPLLGRMFDSEEICELAEINLIPPGDLSLMTQKGSQYKKLFQISQRRFIETGIVQRQRLIWVSKKPECFSNAKVTSVTIDQVFLAFVILFVGVVMALVLLCLEIFSLY